MPPIDEATAERWLDALAVELSLYSVGFLEFFIAQDGLDARPMGTGTMVSIGSAKGILTAAHVVQAVSEKEVGIVRVGLGQKHMQKLKLDLKLATPYTLDTTIANPTTAEKRSPDLGFLLLPEPDVATLSTTHSFYNLDKGRRADLTAHELPETGIGEEVFGVVGQWTEELPPSRPDTRTKGVNAVLCAGRSSNWRDANTYDICDFTLDPTWAGRHITDFGGMSGGPLWRFAANALNTGLDRALAGVIYWQEGIGTDNHRICCHGIESIARMTEFVRSKRS
jgi:hypothetical protein